MSFLCLGIIEYQHEFFRQEVKRVFGERINKLTLLFPWEGIAIFVCMAEPVIHPQIEMFAAGFASGFRSAL